MGFFREVVEDPVCCTRDVWHLLKRSYEVLRWLWQYTFPNVSSLIVLFMRIVIFVLLRDNLLMVVLSQPLLEA